MTINISIIVVLDLVTALMARYAYNEGETWAVIVSMLALTLAGYFFIKTLETHVTALLNAIWIGLGTTLVTISSFFIFGEIISTSQGLALITIVIGLALVGYEPKAIPQEIT